MNGKYAKPSSFAPHERAYKSAYGAPVSQPILSKRVHHKAKAQPQLRSSPLPASEASRRVVPVRVGVV